MIGLLKMHVNYNSFTEIFIEIQLQDLLNPNSSVRKIFIFHTFSRKQYIPEKKSYHPVLTLSQIYKNRHMFR